MIDFRAESRRSERSAWWGMAGNLILTVLKIVIGVVGHSRALVADGVHSGADLASSVAVVVGLRVSRQPPDAEHNYGHAKAEAVAQKVVAVLLLLAGFELGNNAVGAFSHPAVQAPSLLTLYVALGAMVLKESMYRQQSRVARKTGSHALMASAKDNRIDVISSGLAAAGIVGSQLGIPHSDAVGALAVAALVAWLGVQLFSQAANDLMDRAADPQLVSAIRQMVQGVGAVHWISEVRTRMAGTQILVDIKVVVDRELSLVEAHEVAHRVKSAIMTLPRIQDVMVHVNPSEANASTQSEGQ